MNLNKRASRKQEHTRNADLSGLPDPTGLSAPTSSELPEGWEVTGIGSVVKEGKRALNPQDFPDERFEYFSIPAYQESNKPVFEVGKNIRSQKLLVGYETVLFGKLNPRVPKVWLVKSNSPVRKLASTEFIPLVPLEERLDAEYLYFLCWSGYVMPRSQSLVSGSTPSRQRIDSKAFLQIKIPLPPLPEQRAIARVLSTLQRAIEAQDKLIAAARTLKRALMRHLFTYGAVPPAQAERVPLKETEIGAVPEGWRVVKFADVVEIASGQVIPIDEPYKSMIHVGSENIEPNTGRLLSTKTNSELKVISGNYVFERGDILYSKIRPYLNKVVMPPFAGTCSADIYPLRANKDCLIQTFLFHYLLSETFKASAISFQDRTGIPKINRRQLGSIALPAPSLDEQRAIARILSAVDKKIAAEEKRKAALQTLFKTMLHQLMTGQMSIKV